MFPPQTGVLVEPMSGGNMEICNSAA